MPVDDILLEAEEHMDKAVERLHHELRGVRTGRATPGLVEFVKVDYYGSPTDLKNIASITVPEPTQLLIKPFSPQDIGAVMKGLDAANLGLSPQSDGKQIRLNLPAMSQDRRRQMVAQCKEMGEKTRIAIRNARRDANKALDAEQKDGGLTEDEATKAKDDVQELTKSYEEKVTEAVTKKEHEVMEV